MFNTTFYNISVIWRQSVLLVIGTDYISSGFLAPKDM